MTCNHPTMNKGSHIEYVKLLTKLCTYEQGKPHRVSKTVVKAVYLSSSRGSLLSLITYVSLLAIVSLFKGP